MTTLWVATPLRVRKDFEPITIYTNIRALQANIQTDYNELDLKQYGNTVNELIKLRFPSPPELSIDDMLYLKKPEGTNMTVGEQALVDYGKGDYQVLAMVSGYWQRARNPVTIRAKAVVK